MSLKQKIEHLTDICHESVTIYINEHYRGSGETTREYIKDLDKDMPTEDIMQEIERTNRFIEVIIYPRNQITSFRIIHYDVETAIDIATEAAEDYIKSYDWEG